MEYGHVWCMSTGTDKKEGNGGLALGPYRTTNKAQFSATATSYTDIKKQETQQTACPTWKQDKARDVGLHHPNPATIKAKRRLLCARVSS